MTLITYPTRVHFADHVLEEALHSELESAGSKRPLLIADHVTMASELADRVRGGLPRRASVREVTFTAGDDLRKVAKAAIDRTELADCLIAFGTAPALELGRKCRYVQATISGRRPQFFAIPGVDGLPNPCTRHVESWRAGLPSVLICDPTVTAAAGQGASLRSSILSLVRCVESYLSLAYNPLADGIALEGVSRCFINLPKIGPDTDIAVKRELMAAGLNAAFAQEKGIGPVLSLSASLAQAAPSHDEAAIARLVLPVVIKACAMDPDKVGVLHKVLGDREKTLDQAISGLLAEMPLPQSLADMGIPRPALTSAAQTMAGNAGLTFDSALAALESIYEEA